MGLDDAPTDRKSEPDSCGARVGPAPKLLEDDLLGSRRNPGPRSATSMATPSGSSRAPISIGAARRRVLDRVLDEVDEDLLEQDRVNGQER